MSNPKPKVLFVDDEEAILRSLSWTFDDDPDLDILTTSDPRRALSLLNTQNISVLVTDERMPDLPGHQLVKHCKTLSPTTLAMVMSGFAESQPMVNALLSGKIHRFLSKPWQPEGIVHIIKQAVKLVQYQQARRESMKLLAQGQAKTQAPATSLSQRMQRLREQGSNPLVTQAQLLSPQAKTVAYWQQYQHQHNSQQALVAERVAQVALWLGQKLYFGQEQLNQLAIAGQLYAIGQLSLPTGLRDHLRQQQLGLMKDHSHLIQHYHDVLVSAALIERLENATEASHWVLAHGERFDGQGGPFGLKGALIPMGARVLAIAIAFVTAYDKTLYLTGHASLKHTLQTLEQQANTVLDPYGVGLLEQYTEADWLSV